MLLSDDAIRGALDFGGLVIDPLDRDNIQPSSVDVHLADTIRMFRSDCGKLDPYNIDPNATFEATIPSTGWAIEPGDFVLASTLEYVELPAYLAARLEGRSTLGRLGLSIHSTAGFIDPCFHGTITLEMSVQGPAPLVLFPRMSIGQLCFIRMSTPVRTPYGSSELGSKYQGQRGPTAPRSLRRPS